jgi:carboxyl-terminal processing protease
VEYLEEEQVAVLRLLRFDHQAPSQLREALLALPLAELKGIVLDLRYNPGGILASAVEVASIFIDQGLIVKTAGPAYGDREYYSRGNTFPNLPLAVLVNEGTASAAEIVAGAIQDHRVGVLIGRQTFGKGLVQEFVMQLPDGSMIKLTTGEYFTPDGSPVQDVGLTPDIPVEWPEEVAEGEDPDLARALEWIQEQVGEPVGSP